MEAEEVLLQEARLYPKEVEEVLLSIRLILMEVDNRLFPIKVAL